MSIVVPKELLLAFRISPLHIKSEKSQILVTNDDLLVFRYVGTSLGVKEYDWVTLVVERNDLHIFYEIPIENKVACL